MKIVCNKNKPPLSGILLAEHLKPSHKLDVTWGETNTVEGRSFRTGNDLLRLLARLPPAQMHGTTFDERTQVDHWLSMALGPLTTKNELQRSVIELNRILASVTYLVAKKLTVADFAVFAALYTNKEFNQLLSSASVPCHLQRWFNLISSLESVRKALANLPEDILTSLTSTGTKANKGAPKQEGKFVELPGAEMGKVVVRFPPEASGYLHIGHAKAALLNQYYQQQFAGKLIMRFDDTNPAKENTHFEEVILQDLKMLRIEPDQFTYTSDYFDVMLQYCERLIREGKAYVDDTDAETMKQEREKRIEGINRNNSVEKNLILWREMQEGSEKGQRCCVRAKIDMQSDNGCMRDPTIYRCKAEVHPRTGNKYKVYPTYDFACPIVDALEGVTHTLRTMEYRDRDPQFYWFIDALKLRKPLIWEYSRLSMTNTVLSKRKLAWFVQQGLVDGWDDPRFPTVRGVLRRGMTVEGLRQFIVSQGSSRAVVAMEWDKIWAINKKVIDPIAPRYTTISTTNIPIFVSGITSEMITVPLHPKNAAVGEKQINIGPKILIDYEDAVELKEGENVTFINWGNLLIKKIHRENDKITLVEADPNLSNKDYKKTLKLTWLSASEDLTPCYCVYFDHIISKAVLAKDEDFKKYIGHQTRLELEMLGDATLKTLKQGDIIQLQRRGFFRVDVPFSPSTDTCSKITPVILFAIPDGHSGTTCGLPSFKANTIRNESKPVLNVKKDCVTVTKKFKKYIISEELVLDSISDETVASETSPDQKVILEKLLNLKKEFCPFGIKKVEESTGTTLKLEDTNSESKLEEITRKIAVQGEKVRDLKRQKVEKSLIESEVKILLNLKSDFKNLTGKDWKPDNTDNKTETLKNNNTEVELLQEITAQGQKVRDLKAQKTDKSIVDAEVKVLLKLKTDFKNLTGKDWKPDLKPETSVPQKAELKTSNKEAELLNEISNQGQKIRDLKAQKTDKSIVDAEVKVLLKLKTDFKNLTGKDWKPDIKPENLNSNKMQPECANANKEIELLNNIAIQGQKVRTLKSQKAEKSVIDAEVKILLNLKADFKNLAGKDWKPDLQIENSINTTKPLETTKEETELLEKIATQGDKIRNLKTQKAEKTLIDSEVKILLQLKENYKNLTGKEWKPITSQSDKCEKVQKLEKISEKPKKSEKSSETVKKSSKKTSESTKVEDTKKQTRLCLEAKKEENLSEWYSQVITKGELIEYYDVSGCYIYRPWSYAIWESIKDYFDAEIKKLGVQNCYFPIFVSKTVLEKEKTHIADFAPEVAWVTQSGSSPLPEPIAVRPTSETVMYPAYAKWIQSHRDLPLKLNQWNNVVRWEFKHPQPFLRTREFLWQEGHTAFGQKEEAEEETKVILDLYAKVYEELLAVPVVKGRKTEKEKFAGGDYTLTVEAFVSASGRGIQGATSHHLGQNFSKMFDITFEDPVTQQKQFVWQNSWGITTRTIGVMIMIHADNQGLVLPPKVASIQVIIVPCGLTVSLPEQDKKQLQDSCDALEKELKEMGIRAKGDYRANYSPGWKFNHWELKGVPLRIELGPKDLQNNQLVAVRRDTGEKITIQRQNVEKIDQLLKDIQQSLFQKALTQLQTHMVKTTEWKNFTSILDKKNIILAPFCGEIECEDKIKADSCRDDSEVDPGAPSMGAKALCIPLQQPMEISAQDKCIHPSCSKKPLYYTLFGRSY